MAHAPAGMPQTHEGTRQNPEGLPQTSERTRQTPEGTRQTPEGMRQTPEGTSQKLEGMPQKLEGMPQKLEGMPQKAEKMRKKPEQMPQKAGLFSAPFGAKWQKVWQNGLFRPSPALLGPSRDADGAATGGAGARDIHPPPLGARTSPFPAAFPSLLRFFAVNLPLVGFSARRRRGPGFPFPWPR